MRSKEISQSTNNHAQQLAKKTGIKRTIQHPGPTPEEAYRAVSTPLIESKVVLPARQNLHDAIEKAFQNIGCQSGYASVANAHVSPLHYVYPALSPDDQHAAWYSDLVTLTGDCIIEQAGLVLGEKDNAPFIHCHGIWAESGGESRMGHLFAKQSILLADVEATLYGFRKAGFRVQTDSQTNFALFGPIVQQSFAEVEYSVSDAALSNAVLASIRPNQDLGDTLLDIATEQGFERAKVFGLGSFVGVDFADGRHVPSSATEALITNAKLDVLRREAEIDIALVDIHATIYRGRLKPQSNPVCVTFEAIIVEG